MVSALFHWRRLSIRVKGAVWTGQGRAASTKRYHFFYYYYYYYYCVETGWPLYTLRSCPSVREGPSLICMLHTHPPHPLSTVSENELQRILQMSNAPYQQMGNAPLSDS